eukprot:6033977-Alexandrium_andersonii.AAC.2
MPRARQRGEVLIRNAGMPHPLPCAAKALSPCGLMNSPQAARDRLWDPRRHRRATLSDSWSMMAGGDAGGWVDVAIKA